MINIIKNANDFMPLACFYSAFIIIIVMAIIDKVL
jgi:hypothetical protein